MKIQYFIKCTILYICKGFFKIGIPTCNNNDEMTNGGKNKFPDSGKELAKGSDRRSECS